MIDTFDNLVFCYLIYLFIPLKHSTFGTHIINVT